MKFLDELKWRGLVKDVTDVEALEKQLEESTVVYCGFDPTADSLHRTSSTNHPIKEIPECRT